MPTTAFFTTMDEDMTQIDTDNDTPSFEEYSHQGDMQSLQRDS
jgi:hypothetical protein